MFFLFEIFHLHFRWYDFCSLPHVDRSLIYSMETVVIDWTNLVYKVLKKDSSDLLLEGKNPTPHAELSFWKNRLV